MQPLLITIIGVLVSFAIAVTAGIAGLVYVVGVFITGTLVALSSKGLRHAAMASVVGLGVLWLAPSLWIQFVGGPYAGVHVVTLGVYVLVTLVPLSLGFGVGAAIVIAATRRRERAAGEPPESARA